MSSQTQVSDLREFVEFAREHLRSIGDDTTPEEVLDRWRAEHPDPNETAEVVAALTVAIEESERGEGRSLEDFDRAFRRKHGFPDDK